MKPIRVALADDHHLVRAGMRAMLASLSGIEIVAEAADGLEALDRVQATRPDVLLVDVSMPGLNGIDLAARIGSERLPTRIVIISASAHEEQVIRAVRAGVCGYLRKDASPAELELAVRAAAEGQTYFSPVAAGHLTEHLRRGETAAGPLDRLTPRQREILQLIGEGLANKQVAARLRISIKTVEAHRTELMERLDIHDIAALVRFAIRTGLVDP